MEIGVGYGYLSMVIKSSFRRATFTFTRIKYKLKIQSSGCYLFTNKKWSIKTLRKWGLQPHFLRVIA